MVTNTIQNYGNQKEFIFDHWADIQQLRKSMSAAKVVKVYNGVFSRTALYKYEKMVTK